MTGNDLPRLLYLCDIPPETTPGNTAMYRLLQNYPADRLRIVLGNVQRRRTDQQLQGPQYGTIATAKIPRLLYTRWATYYGAWLFSTAFSKAHLVDSAIDGFKPEAVFSVAQNYTWLVAEAFARKRGIPLHLAVWDDFIRMAQLPPMMRGFAEKRFGQVYRRAASRLCISPNMADHLEKRFGAAGDVLYPLRASDLPAFDAPPQRLARETNQLTFAFAGSVNYGPYAAMIGKLAKVLGDAGHKLLVFGGIDADVAERSGIAGPHVTRFPLLPFSEVLDKMRTEVDALFAPMTFQADMALDMHISFPSKLSDYTAVGLPLLIWGPDECSAARWVRENPGSAILINRDDTAALAQGVSQIAANGERRMALGWGALKAGRIFDHSAVTQNFHRCLLAKK